MVEGLREGPALSFKTSEADVEGGKYARISRPNSGRVGLSHCRRQSRAKVLGQGNQGELLNLSQRLKSAGLFCGSKRLAESLSRVLAPLLIQPDSSNHAPVASCVTGAYLSGE